MKFLAEKYLGPSNVFIMELSAKKYINTLTVSVAIFSYFRMRPS